MDVLPSWRKAASVADTAYKAGSIRFGSETSSGIAATDKTSLPYLFSISPRRAEPGLTTRQIEIPAYTRCPQAELQPVIPLIL